MSMESDFRAVLAGDPAIIALVPAARIYPVNYPQGAASPAIRYEKVAGAIGLHMLGSDGLSTDTIQVDVRVAVVDGVAAATAAINIGKAIIARLHAFAGIEGGTTFQVIQLQSDRGASFDGSGAIKYYTASADFEVWSRQNP